MIKTYLFLSALVVVKSAVAAPTVAEAFTDTIPRETVAPDLRVTARDPRLKLVMHPAATVMTDDGRQPFLFCSAQGTLLCQAQLRAPPFNDSKERYVYWDRIGTAISRDGGATWKRFTVRENRDDVYIEGGAVQCADGTVLLLDMGVVPSDRPDHGTGFLWKSHDDLVTWEGPSAVDIYLPGVRFGATADDRGQPCRACWMHRSILELPNGDLLATMYGWFEGDTAPCAFQPLAKKSRSVVIRSRDRGSHWAYLATLGVDAGVGTEGFNEPVLVRIEQGPHAGRLLCLMRTGRDLYGAHSEDDGATWSRPTPVHFPGIDIYRTELWEHLFVNPKAADYIPTDEMIGALVDPDLIQMRNGILVCAVGVRMPARRSLFSNWHAPQNGDYLAFSFDGGESWSEVAQFVSGAPTTHYMGIREVAPGVLYVVYDDSVFKMPGRAVGFRLGVERTDR